MEAVPLIIAGSGRSGTTWVLDAIAEANRLRPIFEPLHPIRVPEGRPFANRYVRDDANDAELKRFFTKIFEGKLNGLWLNYRVHAKALKPSLKNMTLWEYNYSLLSKYKKSLVLFFRYFRKKSFRPIIKSIRANLMLGWLAKHFDAKIALLVRHPGAVAASRIAASKGRGGAVWGFDHPEQQSLFHQYQEDLHLREDFLYRYKGIFQRKLSPIAGITAMWCIENVLPIIKAQQSGRCFVFYEELIVNPDSEFHRIIRVLGLQRTPEESYITRPSQQASNRTLKKTFDARHVDSWMRDFTKVELDEMHEVLRFFDVDIYSAYDPMPSNRIQQDIRNNHL